MKLEVKEALAWLEEHSSEKIRDEMLPRYGINAPKAFGVSVANLHKLAKITGHNHEFALALWKTGWYEARMLTAFVDEPEQCFGFDRTIGRQLRGSPVVAFKVGRDITH